MPGAVDKTPVVVRIAQEHGGNVARDCLCFNIAHYFVLIGI